jgi:polygalacturonase
MRILFPPRGFAARKRPLLKQILRTAAWTASPVLACGSAWGDPTLPTIGPVVYNVTLPNGGVSGASIDGGLTATGDGATNDTSIIQAFINYAASTKTVVNGVTVNGATVEIPASASPYLTNELLIGNSVNLQVDSGATLQNMSPLNTMISTSGFRTNVEISGGGILNDNATSTSNNNMLNLEAIENLLVNGVTIENASHEHLVTEGDENVTINSITIKDAVNLSNTDGVDYSGFNYLISNSTISDGDDDIVAKPDGVPCSNISILNDTILQGHGISIGAQTNAGLNNMTVNNITFNGSTFGFRLKSGRGTGGLVTNITFNAVTMVNVGAPIVIDSWYNSTSGSDNYPTPAAANATAATLNSTTPIWSNITFSNISVALQSQKSSIYGLPEAPVQNIQFINDTLGNQVLQVNFAGYNGTYSPTLVPGTEILLQNTSINHSALTSESQLSNSNVFTQTPNGQFQADIMIEVPEPSCGFLVVGGLALLMRRRAPEETKPAN